MSSSAKNFEAIVKAKDDHNQRCEWPPHTVVMSPFDIQRLGWEEGDDIAGLTLKADDEQQPEHFRLICDRPVRTSGGSTTSTVEKREPVTA